MNAGLLAVTFILVLILANGFLSMSEIAIVSARKALLQSRAEAGSLRYRAALKLANSPGSFLSTVQIGITLVGILAGVAGEAALAGKLVGWLTNAGLSPALSQWVSGGLVVVTITYLSLVLGELTPKHIGLIHAEKVSAAVAPIIRLLSQAASPLVWLLNRSSALVLRLLGVRPSLEPTVTEEEIKILIDQGTALGVFAPVEDTIVDQVFRLGDQKTASITIPRREITWLDIEDTPEVSYQKIMQSDYANFPVAEGNLDRLLGYARANDLLTQCLTKGGIDLRAVIRPPLYLPENMPVFEALARFRDSGDEFAFVIDEYGGVLGLITEHHILDILVGGLPSREEREHPSAVKRADGSWLLDGSMPVEDFRELFGLRELPGEVQDYFHTLAGFVMTALGKIPAAGESLQWEHLHIEVVDMDGQRIDKLLVLVKPPGE